MIQYKEATTLLYNFHVTVKEITEIIIVFFIAFAQSVNCKRYF